MNKEDFLWVEKYRPQTVAETILPADMKRKFQQFVDDQNVPNLLLVGPAGTGKTTTAKAMLKEIDADYMVINGSLMPNIDTLRVDVSKFASAVSMKGGRKYVIFDEADYLNGKSTQPALRNFMEEFSKNCGFILTGNFDERIIEPLKSRCSVMSFNFDRPTKAKLAGMFYKRVVDILNAESVPFDEMALKTVVKKFHPDWRRILNELQQYSALGEIDADIIKVINNDYDFDLVLKHLKSKDFKAMRQWVEDSTDMSTPDFYGAFYDKLPPKLDSDSDIATSLLLLAEYQYKEAFVANLAINRSALLAEIMSEVVFDG